MLARRTAKVTKLTELWLHEERKEEGNYPLAKPRMDGWNTEGLNGSNTVLTCRASVNFPKKYSRTVLQLNMFKFC